MTRARDNADLVHTLTGGTDGQTFQASDSSSTLGAFSTATALTLPTVTSISPTVMLPSTNTTFTITGTNFDTVQRPSDNDVPNTATPTNTSLPTIVALTQSSTTTATLPQPKA